MPNYRRYYLPGHPVFITNVTFDRKKILTEAENLHLLWDTLFAVKARYEFNLNAYVILPDHFHWIITIPGESLNFSKIMLNFKWNYSMNYKKLNRQNREIHIWQRGFWDHIIRDEKDYRNHLDYIHWNPVKHGYVENPSEWEWSSFLEFCEKDVYLPEWGKNEPESIKEMHFE